MRNQPFSSNSVGLQQNRSLACKVNQDKVTFVFWARVGYHLQHLIFCPLIFEKTVDKPFDAYFSAAAADHPNLRGHL